MIALITDFGEKDHYTSVMKGVIKKESPQTDIVDLTHSIDPQDIRQAAFSLQYAYPYFPDKTIFTVVVDPGVGSERKVIAVETENYFFIAPDNGVLSQIYKKERIKNIYNITNRDLFLNEVSSTFHGRDIFAPVSAHLNKTGDITELGDKISLSEIKMLNFDPEFLSPFELKARVIDIDRFGNIISNLNIDEVRNHSISSVSLKGHLFNELSKTFSDVGANEPLAYKGSSGMLEIALRNGNFADKFDIKKNDEIIIKLKGKS